MADWLIEVNVDDTADLTLNGRSIQYDIEEGEEGALEIIREHKKGGRGRRVTVREVDGYQFTVTS
jgi:hypothetical protein